MCVDIEEVVGRCAVCQKNRAANQKQPLIPHTVPALRWQQVALDIMTHRGKDYLVAVDYLSKFSEIALLERKPAACVIMHLKSMFARHGIGDHLMSDNMPFASRSTGCSTLSSGSTLTCFQPHGGTSVTKANTRYSASS